MNNPIIEPAQLIDEQAAEDYLQRHWEEKGGRKAGNIEPTTKSKTGIFIQSLKFFNSSEEGGLKSVPLGKLLEQTPTRAIEFAVKGMLPKGPLGSSMFKKLKVYAGPTHRHTAQQPKSLSF